MREPQALFANFNFHPSLCVGCGAWGTACMDEHDAFPVSSARTPLRRIGEQQRVRGGKPVLSWYSVGCLHCGSHECMDVCPKNCFSLDRETGTVQLDNAACIGCRACARACRFDGIVFWADKAEKCDGCLHRLRHGRTPRCVDACPRHAITIDDRPAVRAAEQEKLVRVLAAEKR